MKVCYLMCIHSGPDLLILMRVRTSTAFRTTQREILCDIAYHTCSSSGVLICNIKHTPHVMY